MARVDPARYPLVLPLTLPTHPRTHAPTYPSKTSLSDPPIPHQSGSLLTARADTGERVDAEEAALNRAAADATLRAALHQQAR